MKVAFITRFQVVGTQGGTERITQSVSDILSNKFGVECYSLYYNELSRNKGGIFTGEAKIDNLNREESIKRFILNWGIDIIISQNEFEAAIMLHKIFGKRVKIVFVHHFQPGWEAKTLSLHIALRKLKYGQGRDKKAALKQLLATPYLLNKQKRFPLLYRRVLESVDRLVLLSKGFIKPFSRYASIEIAEDKISVIPNMLSFKSFANEEELKRKQKRVLVVCRMDETQKKISRVLKIWQFLIKDPDLADWQLDIVGNGPDLEYYKKIVRQNCIPNIIFYGSQDPRPFYLKSPILLMTSESEGWGLTLTEAQQFGCIPIAFDTYESLHDIITDGIDGCIIPKDDMNGFIEKLKQLMSNFHKLTPLMKNAVESSKRFTAETIGQEWFNMLCSL